MKPEDKIKAKTQVVRFTWAGGQREVRVDGTFKYLFKPNEYGHSVCLVPTNSHREWMYRYEWFEPYFLHDTKPVIKEAEPLPDGMFEEKVAFVDEPKPAAAPEVIKTIADKLGRGRPRKTTGA